MNEAPSIWDRVKTALNQDGGAPQAGAADFNPQDPKYLDAQRRGTAYYFQHGKSLPLNQLMADPNLGR